MVEALQKAFSHLQLTLHFHNTRGMGLANLLAAVQGGITRFDGSLGGLGGCPYAPGASGNISSEDAIHMLDAMGYDTGIDLARLLPIARQLPELVGHAVPGQVAKAGRITDLHPPPDAVIAAREPASVGATSFDAGPPQVETAPSGGSAAHEVASVGATSS
jgi:hydroxymethylglutaryl-CoA lyase